LPLAAALVFSRSTTTTEVNNKYVGYSPDFGAFFYYDHGLSMNRSLLNLLPTDERKGILATTTPLLRHFFWLLLFEE